MRSQSRFQCTEMSEQYIWWSDVTVICGHGTISMLVVAWRSGSVVGLDQRS